MTPRHRSSIVVPGLLAVALIAAGCQDSTTTALKRPSFWGGQEQCPTAKFTGGGRIDSPPVNSMPGKVTFGFNVFANGPNCTRSEEHTSELQSPCNLVCRLLLEKKKKSNKRSIHCTARNTKGPLIYR